MATTISIPCFLLPQSSWKLSIPASRVLPQSYKRPLATSLLPRRPLSNKAHHPNQLPYVRPSIATITRIIYPNVPRDLVAFNHPFSTTRRLGRDHHFDTLKFVQRLKDEGFSEEQSKAMMLVLSDVIEESIQNLTRTMVLREGGFIFISPSLSLSHSFSTISIPPYPTLSHGC